MIPFKNRLLKKAITAKNVRRRFRRLIRASLRRWPAVVGVLFSFCLVFDAVKMSPKAKVADDAESESREVAFEEDETENELFGALLDADYDKDAYSIDEDRYKDTLLLEGEDLGEEYIDETLFIGDSNTVRMMNYGFTSLENTLAVTGMGIQSVESLKCIEFEGYAGPVTIPEAVKLMQPKRVIITYGTNNAGGMPTETFIKKYREVIGILNDAYPYADIIINSVPPFHKVNKYPSLSMKVIDEYNAALADMADEMGLKFLNTASVLKDPATGFAKDECTVNDGIHITKAGFEAMFEYIRTHGYVTEDTRPKPLAAVPVQKGTVYVISSDGKISHDASAYGDMSDAGEPVASLPDASHVHSYSAWYDNGNGTHSRSCACMDTQTEGHSYASSVIKEPSYSEEGRRKYTCTLCGASYTESISRLEKSDEQSPSQSPSSQDSNSQETSQESPAEDAEVDFGEDDGKGSGEDASSDEGSGGSDQGSDGDAGAEDGSDQGSDGDAGAEDGGAEDGGDN